MPVLVLVLALVDDPDDVKFMVAVSNPLSSGLGMPAAVPKRASKREAER